MRVRTHTWSSQCLYLSIFKCVATGTKLDEHENEIDGRLAGRQNSAKFRKF